VERAYVTDSILPAGLLLGLLLGMRHAFEPDHLAAVSTLVARGQSARAGFLVGAAWGLGHTLSLLAVGIVVGVLHVEFPARLSATFEFCVALMLIGLGARAIRRAVRMGARGPLVLHVHKSLGHTHASSGAHVHVGGLALAHQPLWVGLMHGLAGSGALTALTLAHMNTMTGRVLFMLLFGLGSVLGMGLLSGAVGLPLARLWQRDGFARALTAATGAASLVVGVLWGYAALGSVFAV
jgi:hypothetical protein